MYEPGESVIRYCDIFPATVAPWEAPLPVQRNGEAQSVMLRAIVTERYLTVGYQFGQTIYRVDIDIDPADAAGVSYLGGQVGKWTVGRRGGCRCNANKLAGWDPFPGVQLSSPARIVPAALNPSYGLPSPRYSRT